MDSKLLLISETAIDHLLGSRAVRAAMLPSKDTPGIYFNRFSDLVTGVATGREVDGEYLALVSIETLASIGSTFDHVFARIARVLKAASNPPIHLPRSWSEFHYKNRLTFFAVPESEGKDRWLCEIDGTLRIVKFLGFSNSRVKQDLDSWTPPPVPDESRRFRGWSEELRSKASDEALDPSFSEQADLAAIGSEAVVQGYSYSEWLDRLKDGQKRVVEAPIGTSMRVIGPAGSGKTLTLCMRAMRLALDSEIIASRKKILIVTHSWAMTERIDGILHSLSDGVVPSSISVLPLLYALQTHAGSVSQLPGSVLGEDSAEGQRMALELIDGILSDASMRPSETLKSKMSEYVRRASDAAPGSSARNDLVIDVYEEIVGVLSPQGIWPSEGDRVAEYLVADRDKDLPPFATKADREYCIRVFDKLLEILVDMGAVTTDQLVLDCIRVFETFSWNVRRETDGYDFILIDELQLFDSQERLAVSLLSRSKPGMLFLSVEDPSQGLFSAVNSRAPAIRSSDPVYLEETHRFRAGLFEFISFLYGKFPLNAVPIRAALSESKSRKPRLTQLAQRIDVVDWCVQRVKELHSENEKGRRICVVCVGPYESEIFAALRALGDIPVVLLQSFDDVEVLSYQRRSVVVTPWQFIGGTQFTDVILVTAGMSRPTTAHAKLRELTAIYLGSSRASSSLDIVTDARIPDVLQQAAKDRFMTKAMVIGGSRS